MRILVTVSPRMYREALALYLHRHRPGNEVRMAPPEATEEELEGFQPHLLVHNDTAVIAHERLEGVPYRVEIAYSDGMEAYMGPDSELGEARDASGQELLRAVDQAAAVTGEDPKPG